MMQFKHKPRPQSSSPLLRTALSLAVSAVVAQPLYAQTTPAQPVANEPTEQKKDAPAKIESVVVTGSRIANPNLTSISPIATLGQAELELSRALNIERLVTTLPQFQGSFGQVSNGNDSRGAATLDLRNLGQNRTLVLIDGKRGAPFGFRNSFDINAIPGPLVKRVDVLTGGAAAVYGADAVAGVVNFILNDRFEGVEAALTGNIATEGDAGEYGANVTAGKNLQGRGNISGYFGWSKRDGLLKGDRSFAAPEANDAGPLTVRPIGGVFSRSDNAAVFNFSGVGGTAGQTRFGFTDTGTLSSAALTSVLSQREALVLPSDRVNAAVFFSLDITPALTGYGRAMYSKTTVEERQAPANTATTFLIRRNNPFITPQLAGVLAGAYNRDAAGNVGGTDAFLASVSRSFLELSDRVLETDRESSQIQFGLKGEASSNIAWDVYAQYGRTTEDTTITGDALLANLRQAADVTVDDSGKPVCANPANGCVPINLFGSGSISPEAARFIAQTVTQDRTRDQLIGAGTLNINTQGWFSLPGGPADIVIGAEYRREKGQANFDDFINNGLTLNQGRRLDFGGPLTVKELFAETRLPIVRNAPFAKAFDVEAAYRYSDYKESSSTDAWKWGLDWAVNNDVRFRGSEQRVVRAPNVGERYGVLSSVALQGRTNDPCANIAASGANAALCAASGAPAGNYTEDLTGAQFFFGGSPAIKPETGKTKTIGAVLTPSVAKGLTFSLDYYDIAIDNAISAYGAQVVTTGCYVLGIQQFCSRITRGPNGQISAVDSTDSNIALLRVKGYDVGALARFKPGFIAGEMSASYNADIVSSITQQQAPGSVVIECAGKFGPTCGLEVRRAAPKYRHRATLGWSNNAWTWLGTWRVFGKVTDDVAATVFKVEEIKAQHYFDLAATWRYNKNFRITFGAENLFDKKPPIIGSQQFAGNTLPTSYDVIGRRIGFTLTYRN